MALNRRRKSGTRDRSAESGQAVTEYILLLSIIVGGFFIISRGISKVGLTESLMKPVKEDFARAYRYGHPQAKGFEDGGPKNHPRISTNSDNNFRIFISPDMK